MFIMIRHLKNYIWNMYLHYYTYMTEQYIENIFVSTKRAWAIFIPDYSYSMVV